jgi:hypothetical protein
MSFVVTICLVLGAVITGAIGCRKGSAEAPPEIILPRLEQAFGITFPTNGYRMMAASWDFRGHLDGGSANTECLARMELTRRDVLAWRNSVTNSLREYREFSPPVDPRFESKVQWWDVRKFTRDRCTHYFKEIHNGPTDYKRLEIYTFDAGDTNIMYVSAFLSRR